MLTLAMIERRWPQGDQHIAGLRAGIAASAPEVFERYGILSSAKPALVIAHMMAQFSEECGQGLEMIENMSYSAERLLEIFPRHFTPAMARRWAHHPRQIADIAYGGRMGNAPPPSDDGWVHRGAGLSQVTGVEGFKILQAMLDKHNAGFSVLAEPELIVDPAHTLECGVADWLACGCLPFAARDDLAGETFALNGGHNGIAERRRQLLLWKPELGL